MNISSLPLSASNIANQGVSDGLNQLRKHSHDIAYSIVKPVAKDNNPVSIDYDALNAYQPDSLENSLVNMGRTKLQIQSLAKILEVENKLFEDSIGKIFDAKA